MNWKETATPIKSPAMSLKRKLALDISIIMIYNRSSDVCHSTKQNAPHRANGWGNGSQERQQTHERNHLNA